MGNTQDSNKNLREPMRINKIHGNNLEISEEDLVASRKGGFCDAVFLGTRVYDRREKLEIKIRKMEERWNGTIRYGFSILSPMELKRHPEGFPRYSIPDLSKRAKCYIDTYTSNKYRAGDVITFWVNETQDVIIKVNNFPLNHSIPRVPAHGNLWPVVDVYGNVFEVEFRSLSDDYIIASKSQCCRFYASLDLAEFPILNYTNESVEIINQNMVKKHETTTKAYCWNRYPLFYNQIWILFVKDCQDGARGSLDIGVTTQNPNFLLQDSPSNLSNISNICILPKVYIRMRQSDELALCILSSGQIQVALNGGKFELAGRLSEPADSIHHSQFWVIADLAPCPSIFTLESVGLFQLRGPSLPPMPIDYITQSTILKSDDIYNYTRQLLVPESNADEITDNQVVMDTETIEPSEAISNAEGIDDMDDDIRLAIQESLRCYDLEKQRNSICSTDSSLPRPTTPQFVPTQNKNRSLLSESECVICMDMVPDCVFMPCGHLVTCHTCAENLQNEHKRQCPNCRQPIRSLQRVEL